MTASFSPYVFVYFLASTLIAFRLSTTTAETGISVLSYFYFKSEFIVFFSNAIDSDDQRFTVFLNFWAISKETLLLTVQHSTMSM